MVDEVLSIAGIRIRIVDRHPAALRFSGASTSFVTDEPGSDDLTLVVERRDSVPQAHGALLFDSGAVWRLFGDAGTFSIECRSERLGKGPYKIAILDRGLRRGTIVMRSDLAVHPLEYPLDEVLLSQLLSQSRGIELHGCGMLMPGGRAIAFVGQSGAGKTTTARLWLQEERVEIVSDDRLVVRDIDGELRLWGTPWHGEAELSSSSSGPLDAIYLLMQAPENALDPLAPAAAVAGLFACAFPPFFDARAVAFTVEFLERLAAGATVGRLRFRPDRGMVDLVRRTMRSWPSAPRS